jgi:hypothetical protein
VALLVFTGSPVIGVFHTLSAGNAGQRVPGSVVPTSAWARCRDDSWCAEAVETVIAELATIIMTKKIALRPRLFNMRRIA